jgi:predicted O-methyltransferase YrrM
MINEGIGFDHYLMAYNCHVDDARNAVLRDFLNSNCTDLVFIDADVGWEPEALIKLIKHDRDIVAGVYPKRANDEEYPVHVAPGTDLYADKDGLVEVEGAPTGFMKIKRHVVEKMVEANKDRRFLGQGDKSGDKPYTIVFERTYEDGHRWSGDYNFCRKWRQMGGKVFVDPEMHLTHIGETEFSGSLGHHWKRKFGVYKEMFGQAMEEIKAGNINHKTFYNLYVGWGNPFAATDEMIYATYEIAKSLEGDVLETGTGLTTLVMAAANPNITIHALEHDPIWASVLNINAKKYGINNIKVYFAPLKEYESGKWYDDAKLPDQDFSLYLCDGPPRTQGERKVFFEKYGEKMKDSTVLMDDADDDTQTKHIREWAEKYNRKLATLGKARYFIISAK